MRGQGLSLRVVLAGLLLALADAKRAKDKGGGGGGGGGKGKGQGKTTGKAAGAKPKRKLRYYEAGPPALRPLCLNGTKPPQSSAADDGLIHIGFFDTRGKPSTAGMVAAAEQIRKAADNPSKLRFHALLRASGVSVPGMTHELVQLPPDASCVYRGLARLAHGPGPAYLYKPLLHYLMPKVRRLILLDTDIVVLRPIERLYRHFDGFGAAVVGVANEQTNMYQRSSGWRLVGKNGGVQLLDLHGMRASAEYSRSLDEYAAGLTKEWIGFLGDQSLYTQMTGGVWRQLIHTLPCEWNRQISMQFGFGNRTVHTCPNQCALLHANFKPLKCVTPLMQTSPSCKTWRGFYERTQADLRERKGPLCGTNMVGSWNQFQRAMRTYFSDCCVDGL